MIEDRMGVPPHLVLTEAQRKAFSTRLMPQPPTSPGDVANAQRYWKEVGRVAGFSADVLLVLNSILELAEQGNEVAQRLYMSECRRLDITFPRRFGV